MLIMHLCGGKLSSISPFKKKRKYKSNKIAKKQEINEIISDICILLQVTEVLI